MKWKISAGKKIISSSTSGVLIVRRHRRRRPLATADWAAASAVFGWAVKVASAGDVQRRLPTGFAPGLGPQLDHRSWGKRARGYYIAFHGQSANETIAPRVFVRFNCWQERDGERERRGGIDPPTNQSQWENVQKARAIRHVVLLTMHTATGKCQAQENRLWKSIIISLYLHIWHWTIVYGLLYIWSLYFALFRASLLWLSVD